MTDSTNFGAQVVLKVIKELQEEVEHSGVKKDSLHRLKAVLVHFRLNQH